MNNWSRCRLMIWLTAPWMLLNAASMGQADKNKAEYIKTPHVSEDTSYTIVSNTQDQKNYDYEDAFEEDSLVVSYDDENISGILERGSKTNDIWIHFSEGKSHRYELNLYGILGDRISTVKMDTGARHMKFSIPGTFVLPSAPYFVEMKDLETGKSQIQKMFLN